MASINLSIVTYNLHGFNQGSVFLQDLLLHYDIVCVQEHWLSSRDSSLLTNLNNDFLTVASYAVDSVLGRGILKGRPFGGLAIFVKSSIIQNFEIVCNSERLIVLKVNNILICNVYMPCNDDELFNCTLGLIAESIHNRSSNIDYWMVVGDFNLKFMKPDPRWDMFNYFMQSCSLCFTVDHIPAVSHVTYRHQSLNHNSMIDYILVSNSLSDRVSSVAIQDSGLNLSDHLPVIAHFNVNYCGVRNSVCNGSSADPGVKSLRWDRADLSKYYEATYFNLYPIYVELCKFCHSLSPDGDAVFIQNIYANIIDALHASDKVIPRANATFFKHWWNNSLDVLKDCSIECCRLWVAVGKPTTGDIYHKMIQAKLEYKKAILLFKTESEKNFSTELGNTFMAKDMNSFWKSWNSKFKRKSAHANYVGGCNKSDDIAQKFKIFFMQFI